MPEKHHLTTVELEAGLVHAGCSMFMARFGQESLKFINFPAGKRYNRRGINPKVIQPGTARPGDSVKKA
jgi:MOSC domain-containing protein YiiM